MDISPMTTPAGTSSGPFSAGAVLRALAFFVLWATLIGTSPLNLLVGLPAAAAATWASLSLLPAGRRPVSPAGVMLLLARVPYQSLVAGIDVARRALSPDMPLQPGFISYATRLPPGPAPNAFRALVSLQPGTLPVSIEADGDILVHCLDTREPVAAQLAAEENLFIRLVGDGSAGA
jgi:multicomponent Na+:H+ antiporter subunit E